MERHKFRPEIDSRLQLIREIPDNGILAVVAQIDQAMKMHGMMASPCRKQETFDRILDIFTLVSVVFDHKYSVDLVEFLNAIHAELEREARPVFRPQEDWLLMMHAHAQRAMGRRVYECTQALGMHSLYGCDRSSGCLFQVAVSAYAALEDQA